MKKIFCILGLIVLCACERPEYDLQLACEDGAQGQLLIDAQIYESHADLTVKRLSKELRATAMGQNEYAGNIWLGNQVPQIDDVISISLPVNATGDYAIPNKVELDIGRDNLNGGVTFTLLHILDKNMVLDGVEIPAGEYMHGSICQVVASPVNVVPDGVSAEQLKEIKNCMNYISNQLLWDNTPDESRVRVYDEKTGREMYITEKQIDVIFDGIPPVDLMLENLSYNSENIIHACDVAQRLREYISAHIDTEYIRDDNRTITY